MPARIHLLGLLAAAVILSFMVTQPVLPLYLQAHGFLTAEVGLMVGIMSLALVVTELSALAVSRRLGRRGTIVLGSLGGAAAQLWFTLAVARPEWYVSRVLFGACRGFLWPVLFAEVAEAAPAGRHGPAFAVFWLYFGVGLLAGPWIGGWMGETLGLQAPLFASAALSLVPLAFAGAITTRRDAPAISLAGSLRLLLRRREVLSVWTLNTLHATIYGLFATFLPLYAATQGISVGHIGLLFAVGSATFTMAQMPAGRLLERGPTPATLIPAYLGRSLLIAAMPAVHSFGGLIGLNAVLGAAGAVVPPSLAARLAAVTPPDQSVVAMGAHNAAADAGFFLGPVLGGILAGYGLAWPFLITLPLALCAPGLVRLALGPPVESRATPEGTA